MNFFDRDNFGNRFKVVFSERLGITQKGKIAKLLEVSASAVTNYTQGRIPETPILEKIVNFTQCSPTWLLCGIGEKYLQLREGVGVQTRTLPQLEIISKNTPGFIGVTINQVYEVGSTGIQMLQLAKPREVSVPEKELRNQPAENAVLLTAHGNDFQADGYLSGQHILALPCTNADVQDGDLVIVEDDSTHIHIRYWFDLGDRISLDHRLDRDGPIQKRAARLKVLYRVIG